jgi:hypothetical protein
MDTGEEQLTPLISSNVQTKMRVWAAIMIARINQLNESQAMKEIYDQNVQSQKMENTRDKTRMSEQSV